MTVRSTIFGGANEKELFHSIGSQWHSNFSVYPQLPFYAVFDLGNQYLTDKQVSFLMKTSVDYTLCTQEGKPLLCIEFDGEGHGFSRNGEYIQVHPSRDRYRKLKLDLKLKIAQSHGFPLYVVSYDEKVPISQDMHLTVVDGIIGQTLKHQYLPQIAKEWLDDEESSLDELSKFEQDERIQDIVLGAEMTAELDWDPIAKRCAELEEELFRRGVYKGDQYEFVSDPELPDYDWHTGKGFQARIAAWKNVRRWGCKYTAHTTLGDFSETAWVRNFEGASASPMSIAENIAGLLAYNRVMDTISKS